jgi:Plant transposon protein
VFAVAQEGKRKDIERAFGILQAWFHILISSCCLWNRLATKTVIATCIIMHNLIIDYQIEHDDEGAYIKEEAFVPQHPFVLIPRSASKKTANDRATMILDMKNQDLHIQLQHDLMAERMQR